MNDSIAIALKLTAVRGWILGIAAALRIGCGNGVWGEVYGHITLGSSGELCLDDISQYVFFR